MAEKRKRGQNFTTQEKEKLIKLLLTHKNTILNKRTDGTTNKAKNNAWIQITNSFNSSSNNPRSKESLMKVWEKLKSDSKDYYSKIQEKMTQTGTGQTIIKLDPVLEKVCAILDHSCSGILGVLDCDEKFRPETDITLSESTAPYGYYNIIKQENVTRLQEHRHDVTEEEKFADEVNNGQDKIHAPLWAYRGRRLSTCNERSSPSPSTFVSSNIQDLKEQLLREELEFKRKLHELQLQAALKEVEIKTTILEHIKGSGVTFNNLLGTQPTKNQS